MLKKFRLKVFKKPLSLALFIILVFSSAFFRFYRLGPLTTFLDDQGRDVLKAAQILKEGDVPFIGPMASIGNLYLGPIYYWAITPFLWFWHFNPVGPVILVALLGLVTNLALFLFVLNCFDLISAFLVSFLYALSPLVLQNSRFSWNPNPVPFFSLLWFWLLIEFLKKGKGKYFFGAGIALGILIQLHYVTGILFVFTLAIYLYWLISSKKSFSRVDKVRPFLFLVAGIVLPLIPFILFEIKNCFINTRAAGDFIFGSNANRGVDTSVFETFWILTSSLTNELFTKFHFLVYYLLVVLLSPLLFLKKALPKQKWVIIFLPLIFLAAIFSCLLIIKGQIHLHYLGFLNSLVFLSIAAFTYFLRKQRLWLLAVFNILILVLLLVKMAVFDYQWIVKADNNQQIKRSQMVADYVAQKSKSKDIYLTSLTGSPYAYNYRYFLYIKGFATDSLKPSSVFAICEGAPCNPEGHPLWEIAQFGVLKTASGEHVGYGAWVYELVKN
ncbi:hypothetical protein COT63_00755 [Candidatus Shapirobacteria bacterium CG09_land_8_20_14_0_10_38_17]|uniref:Glycosyltransferase RgtA/B/C/D-like domain-containing protein n=1 Tax=Candidatus Shapirobacteria bacterium CG09_land_8_20_14_0_10_38_17 TaxID=1974884 RepID=A0A2H0WTM5_9BACT|nr:MAG: hypothetical protein COT63_00755 [Candidatus Shapirobacteria bacterium CG09_land_8_20_14_0_10_38_17]